MLTVSWTKHDLGDEGSCWVLSLKNGSGSETRLYEIHECTDGEKLRLTTERDGGTDFSVYFPKNSSIKKLKQYCEHATVILGVDPGDLGRRNFIEYFERVGVKVSIDS